MREIKTYTHVRLLEDPEPLKERYEIRTSIFIEFDDNPGRRAISKKPSKEEALAKAKEIALAERARTGG